MLGLCNKAETNHSFYTQFGSLFADVQVRQAVFTNTCTLPFALNALKDSDKFFEAMLEKENLYVINERMKFITRIANEFHYVMKKYPKYMESCLTDLANSRIVEKAPII